jgi:dihydrofolate reductase
MRKIIITTFVTMDGVLQAPGGPEEDGANGFNWGGWSALLWDELMNQAMGSIMDRPFDLLLGRRTYEIFAAHWPYVKDDPIAEAFNNLHKYAVSSKPMKLNWINSTLITGDVAAGLQQLKKQEGPDLLVNGSGRLIQTLLSYGLVDAMHVWTFPVTIGKGKRLFSEGTQPATWKLFDTKISSTGVIIASYEPAGEIQLGSFALETPTSDEVARRKRVAEEQ